jgi:hypothetical protein
MEKELIIFLRCRIQVLHSRMVQKLESVITVSKSILRLSIYFILVVIPVYAWRSAASVESLYLPNTLPFWLVRNDIQFINHKSIM